jgi:hypothetical protein
MVRRRFALILVATAALLGIGATAAEAAITHVYSPVPTGLARVCVSVAAADAGLCVHV